LNYVESDQWVFWRQWKKEELQQVSISGDVSSTY
jgi:hypothetical protein